MNSVTILLAGTSPTLHNCLITHGEDPGWVPADDREQAESRLYRSPCGGLYLPWWHPIVAIGRAAWSRDRDMLWPTERVHAQRGESLRIDQVNFRGEWEPQVFLRRHLPAVALPRFDSWSAWFTLRYDPRFYTPGQLRSLLEVCGRRTGLPQFAPFAKAGLWGRFEVSAWEASVAVVKAETVGVGGLS